MKTKSIIIQPHLRAAAETRDVEFRLEEAIGLAHAIDLDICATEIVSVPQVRAGSYFGSGKVADIGTIVKEQGVELVFVNAALSPIQQRNLERSWKAKVVDRTGIILEIFGERALTAEGRLQVELAHLTYQKSRLVRSWTHLERQRGGVGFLGGPGETQKEADRRMLSDKINRIKKRLEEVRRTRGLQRAHRQNSELPTIALVGYTNAGKSTLFNRLTKADTVAKDMLFATLDPTMRAIDLPSGRRVILSDTVGFISDLPTQLVAAFQATLEEVVEADLILHVRDIADVETDTQRDDVLGVLDSLNLDGDDGSVVIEVLNKTDLLDEDDRAAIETAARARNVSARENRGSDGVSQAPISALAGEGLDELLMLIDRKLRSRTVTCDVIAPQHEGALIAWLHENAEILTKADLDDARVLFRVRLSDRVQGRLHKLFEDKFEISTSAFDAQSNAAAATHAGV